MGVLDTVVVMEVDMPEGEGEEFVEAVVQVGVADIEASPNSPRTSISEGSRRKK